MGLFKVTDVELNLQVLQCICNKRSNTFRFQKHTWFYACTVITELYSVLLTTD